MYTFGGFLKYLFMIDVCCALIFDEGTLLAVQRSNDPNHPFQWEFPGGKTEAGESHQACIIREIREELQIDICPLEKLAIVEYSYPNRAIRLIPFVCKIKEGNIKLTEHADMKWITPDVIDQLDWQAADRQLITLNREKVLHHFGENGHDR